MLHKETVAEGTLDLIKKLSADEKFKDFNLVGGTALALQIGHRVSVDIDLFSRKSFDVRQLADHLRNNYPINRIDASGQTLYSIVDSVKLTAIRHQYMDVNPPKIIEGVRMASLEDIAAMKVHAIHNNGTRFKDFLDIYHLLEHKNMDEIMKAYLTKYPDMHETTAKIALGEHKEVRSKSDVTSLRDNLTSFEIFRRINEALTRPDKIFKKTSQRAQKNEDEPNQRLRRRRNRGH
jgi:hypothetical protein